MLFELSIVIPCLNEELTISECIRKAQKFINRNNLKGEIVVSDNGSTDNSVHIASSLGARVVNAIKPGYGSALIHGIKESKGKFIIMGDADNTYDFLNLEVFIQKLRSGYDLVMGNRFLGGVKKGAMPFKHKYIGNPILSFIGRLLYKTDIGDFHCGLRGFTRQAFNSMNLVTTGMEFASEMVVKASLLNMNICEVPVILYPDAKDRKAHLNPWRDGWRHLKFLFIFAPRWLFLYPGSILVTFGSILIVLLQMEKIIISGIKTHYTLMLYISALILIGIQLLFFYLFTSAQARNSYYYEGDKIYENIISIFSLERGIFVGSIFISIGLWLTLQAYQNWQPHFNFGLINLENLKLAIPSVLCITAGIQISIHCLLLYILIIKK